MVKYEKMLMVILKTSIILGVSEVKCESIALISKQHYVMSLSASCKLSCNTIK